MPRTSFHLASRMPPVDNRSVNTSDMASWSPLGGSNERMAYITPLLVTCQTWKHDVHSCASRPEPSCCTVSTISVSIKTGVGLPSAAALMLPSWLFAWRCEVAGTTSTTIDLSLGENKTLCGTIAMSVLHSLCPAQDMVRRSPRRFVSTTRKTECSLANCHLACRHLRSTKEL